MLLMATCNNIIVSHMTRAVQKPSMLACQFWQILKVEKTNVCVCVCVCVCVSTPKAGFPESGPGGPWPTQIFTMNNYFGILQFSMGPLFILDQRKIKKVNVRHRATRLLSPIKDRPYQVAVGYTLIQPRITRSGSSIKSHSISKQHLKQHTFLVSSLLPAQMIRVGTCLLL